MKILVHSFILTSLLLSLQSCDQRKKTTKDISAESLTFHIPSDSEVNDENLIIKTEITNDDISNFGIAEGPSAAGNAIFQTEKSRGDSNLEKLEFPGLERQAMEERTIFDTWNFSESEDSKLDRIQKDKSIFYGYPGATGASGSSISE